MVCIDHVARRVIQLGMNANGWISGHIGGWLGIIFSFIYCYLFARFSFFLLRSESSSATVIGSVGQDKRRNKKILSLFPCVILGPVEKETNDGNIIENKKENKIKCLEKSK